MKNNLKRTMLFLLTAMLWWMGSQFQNAMAQNAQCVNNYNLQLNPNGVGVLVPSDLDNGSTGGNYMYMSYNGAVSTAITFDCQSAGQNISVTLVVEDSLTGNTSTCVSLVSIIASPICGGSGTNNYQLYMDSLTDASNCSTCDASVDFLGIWDPNTGNQAPSPYTFVWSDGSTAQNRNDLCPNQVYTLTVYDALQNAYTQSFAPSCSTTGGGNGPLANCQGAYTILLNPNGVATLSAQDLDAGSSGGQIYLLDGNNFVNSITLDCSHINPAGVAVTLVVIDSTTGQQSTCTSMVYVVDQNNACNGGGGTAPNAVCQNASVALTPNGVYNLTVQDVDGGSTGGSVYLIDPSGALVNSIQLTCADINPAGYQATLVVVDSNGTQSTCGAMVSITDPFGACNGGGSNPPVAVCQNVNLDLGSTATGQAYAILTPNMIDGGSSSSTQIANMWMLDVNGNAHTAYTFDCSMIGTHTFYLVVTDGNTGTVGQTDTCMATVVVTDTNNVCGGGSNNYVIVDSILTNASNCNTCDGSYGLGYVALANGAIAPMPYTVVWNDGVVGDYRNDLCPGSVYTMTIYDALQNAYTYSLTVACNSTGGGTNGCIDPSLIDSTVMCPMVYQPVCGCDGVTYANACEAENWYGVSSWTAGPCNNNGGNNPNVSVTTTGSDCDSTVCSGDATLVVQNSVANAYTVSWSDGFTQTVNGPTIYRDSLCSGTYVVTIVDNASGVVYTVTVLIGTAQGCVWPGDADDNTTVNNWDLLPIALAYGESGSSRANASSNWVGQSATDWNTVNPIAGLPNYKHIDCNGDGLIDQNDLSAVQLNYGQSYVRGNGSGSQAGNIPFYVQSVTANEGDRLNLPIFLGTASDIAADVYGLAFTINYDTEMVDMGSVSVDFINSWLGTNLMDIQYDFSQAGQIEVAVARKDRLNNTGFGEIATLNLTIRDDILRTNTSQTMDLEISNIRLISNDNRTLGTNPQAGVVTVNLNTSTEDLEQTNYDLAIFPNPAKHNAEIQVQGAVIENISIYNAMGQVVQELNGLNTVSQQLDLSDLSAGLYLIQVQTDKGIKTERLVVRP
jgi:hypothetical protein